MGVVRHLFFNNCMICGSEISPKEMICSKCKEKLDKERLSSFLERCPECYYPRLGSEYNCKNCSHENSMPIYSLMDYSGSYCKAIIERFKFFGDKSFAPLIAFFISECIDVLDPSGKGFIVPVPCSASSLKKRGWDQMEQVCRFLNRRCIKAVVNVSTTSVQQKTLDKEERANLASSRYAINPKLSDSDKDYLLSHRAIIVDDICTTGATLYAVAKVLKDSQVKNVCAATWLFEL